MLWAMDTAMLASQNLIKLGLSENQSEGLFLL